MERIIRNTLDSRTNQLPCRKKALLAVLKKANEEVIASLAAAAKEFCSRVCCSRVTFMRIKLFHNKRNKNGTKGGQNDFTLFLTDFVWILV